MQLPRFSCVKTHFVHSYFIFYPEREPNELAFYGLIIIEIIHDTCNYKKIVQNCRVTDKESEDCTINSLAKAVPERNGKQAL
jgi:hypothetical protein